jgi:hypothetical protein
MTKKGDFAGDYETRDGSVISIVEKTSDGFYLGRGADHSAVLLAWDEDGNYATSKKELLGKHPLDLMEAARCR